MKNKQFWFMIPTILIPYLMAAIPLFIFFSVKVPVLNQIMSSVFQNNALILLFVFIIYTVIACCLSALCFFLSIKNHWDSLSLAKTAMIIKLIQIPGYIAVFILGAICLITVFTFAITFIFVLFDFLTLLMTGQLIAASAINASRKGQLSLKRSWWVIALQTVFCADVVTAIVFYKQLRNIQSQQTG